jgi:hypothetical protein
VLGRDIIFNMQHTANWEYIKQNKQRIIDLNNKRENSKGEQLPLNRGTENKYESPYIGSLDMQVNDDGIVCLKVNTTEDAFNIR